MKNINPKNSFSEQSLTSRSIQGFAWLFGHTLVTRLFNFGGQIILAWLLEPKVFGLIGLAYSVNLHATVV